jgi:Leucine-rich repeat (LRR) protein
MVFLIGIVVVSANIAAGQSDESVLQTILTKCGLDGVTANDVAVIENGNIVALNLANKDLSKDGFSTFPVEISQLVSLRDLNCSGNTIETIPPEIGQCHNLQKLDLSSNRIAAIPPEIGHLANLTYLDLRHNDIVSVPPEIANCANLEFLWLWGNKLTDLDPAITKLHKLKELYLTDNRLTTLPVGIVAMRFKYIDLTGNKLCNMGSILDVWAKKYDKDYRNLQRCM